ncbi:ParM/StbA family protein [Sulfobacillus thermosulfidooxidans]|uniref:ParM/StbA family protein n=1 Tax=Sulfobacillus thermosulfidooxidans TaxID=28034 RepID=UPI0006B51486|nr:ParM/StbA family protein [Sulfobacillus thermosulfidooxidans]
MKIAIDVGHGYVKVLNDAQRTMFPALIAPAPPLVELGEAARRPMITQINGEEFLIGDPARPYAVPRWSRDKASDPETLNLMLVAAAAIGAMGPVDLAAGLPLSWFGSGRKAFADALLGLEAQIVLPDGTHTHVWIETTKILPQGVAAASTLLAQSSYDAGDYLVVDIGYRTSDYIVVTKTPTGSLSFHPDQAGSLELGTHAINAWVAEELTKTWNLPFQPAEVEERANVHINGQRVNLDPLRQKALAHLQGQLRDRLIEKLDQTWHKLAGKVLVGGGAIPYAAALPDAHIPDNPQWANAQAYLMALTLSSGVASH